jgi:5-methylcytosine-specific restriction endonuclease McrA
VTSNPLRSGRRYDTERYKFIGVCEANNVMCWLCGKPINYKARAQTPDAFELDHARPVSTHPELAHEPTNFRASHSACNRSRGATPMAVSARGSCWVQADW